MPKIDLNLTKKGSGNFITIYQLEQNTDGRYLHFIFIPLMTILYLNFSFKEIHRLQVGKILFILFLLSIFFNPTISKAQGVVPTKGKDFWLGFLTNPNVNTALKRLDLFITSDRNTNGIISIPQQGWSIPFSVVANVTTTVNIPNIVGEPMIPEIIDNKGIHIESNDTVSVFAINFQPYSSDATKVFPIQSIGNSYRVCSYTGISSGALVYPSEFGMVATQDNTQIIITPTAPTSTGRPANVSFMVTLNAGEIYLVHALSGTDDFTGSTLAGSDSSGSCRPFAVFSGVVCTRIPTNCVACDHIYEQDLPVRAWGTNYAAVPFSFASTYTLRVLANQNGTVVRINNGAPISLGAGQFYSANGITTPSCIQSNLPVMATQFMEGESCAGSGDPSMLYLNPTDQKIDNVTFSTVTSTVITQHNVNIIMDAAYIGQLRLDGLPVSITNFATMPACTGLAYARLSLVQGSHTLKADSGFVAYVYGTGNAESYAYSVGSFSKKPPIIIDSVICSSDTMHIGNSANLFSPWWSTAIRPNDTIAIGQVLTLFPPIAPNLYILHGDESMSGCSKEFYFNIETPTPPVPFISASSDSICQHQPVQLQAGTIPASTLFQYSWSPITGLNNPYISNPIATPSSSTWYVVAIQTASGCGGVVYDSVFIFVRNGNISSYNVTPNDTLFCVGNQLALNMNIQKIIGEDKFDISPSATLWSTISGGVSSSICGSLSGNSLYFTNAGLRAAQTVSMNVTSGGSIQFYLKIANGTLAPCEDADPGEDVILEYSVNAGGSWTTINTYYESLYPSFTLINEQLPIAAQSASTMFRVRQLFHSGLNQDNWCIDDFMISANTSTGFTYSWTPSAGLSSATILNPNAAPLTTTTYVGQAIDNGTGCIYSDSIVVRVGQNFTLNSTPDTSLCSLASIGLFTYPSIPGNYQFLWSPAIGLSNYLSQTPIASPLSTTTYVVNVSSSEGCIQSDTVLVNARTINNFSISATDTSLCTGDSTSMQLNVVRLCGTNGNTCTGPVDSTLFNGSINSSSYEAITPFAGFNACSRRQIIFTATELNARGMTGGRTISSIGLDIGPISGTFIMQNFTIRMGCTSRTAFTTTFEQQPPIVFYPKNITLSQGRIRLVFDNTYDWDGTSNLIIEFCYSNSGSGISMPVYYHLPGFAAAIYVVANFSVCNSATGTSTTYRPDMEFYSCPTLAPSTFTYSWHPTLGVSNPSNPNTTIFPLLTTNYFLTALDQNTGCSFSDSLLIHVGSTTMSVTANPDTTVCSSVGVQLSASHISSSSVSYSWSPATALSNSNTASPTILSDSTQQFIVEITDSVGCTAAFDTVNVIIQSPPRIAFTNDSTICQNTPLQLLATGGSSYHWQYSTALSDTGISNPIALLNQSEMFYVTVNDTIGCNSSDSIYINVKANPSTSIGPDQFVCQGQNVLFNGGSGFSNYHWSDNSTDSLLTVNTSGIYWLEVQNQCGSFIDSAEVTVYDLPPVNLGADVSLCVGTPWQLDAGNVGTTYLWSDNSTTQSISPSVNGNYWVKVIDAHGCVNRDTINLFFRPLPVISLGNDSALCIGQSLEIKANYTNGIYHWNTGEQSENIFVTTTGMYIVQVTDQTNCSNSDTINIAFNPLPIQNIPPTLSYCSNLSTTLDAGNPGSTYAWSTGETVQSIITNATGNVSVFVTNQFHCTIQNTVLLQSYAPPFLNLGNDTTICDGDQLMINAGSNGVIYDWISGEQSQVIVVGASGNYGVTITDANGCKSSDRITVNVQPNPSVSITSSSTIVCDGDSTLLTAISNTGTNFEWLPNLFLSSPYSPITYAFPTSTIDYHLIVNDLFGCHNATDIRLTNIKNPNVTLGNDTSFCEGSSIELKAGDSNNNYSWQNGSHNNSLNISQAGIYWVDASNYCGTIRDSITIQPLYKIPSANLGPGGRICNDPSFILDALNIGSTYIWTTGETTQIIHPLKTGRYDVSITSEHQCKGEAGIDLELVNYPTINFGTDPWYCFGEAVVLNAKTDYGFYQWQDGSMNETYTISSPGIYWVHVKNMCGEANDSLLVNYYDCDCQLFIPSGFSPNGDGKNDRFMASTVCDLTSFNMRIYNRWGVLIFESNTINKAWDGTINGEPAQEAVYVYLINYSGYANRNLESENISGKITLVR